MKNDYNLELIRRKPINYNGLLFHHISFGYICDNIGLENFDKLLTPFLITKDCLDIEDEKLDSLSLFDDIILNDENMLNSIAYILQLFCKCDNVLRNNHSIILQFNDVELEKREKKSRLYDIFNRLFQLFCKKKETDNIEVDEIENIISQRIFTIDKNNFNDVSEIIMKLNGKDKIKVEKPPKNMSDKQRDVWEKLQAGRKRESEKNNVHIYDVINICEFGGNYHIPIEEIDTWSLWEIMNCYKARVNMKTYDDSLKICLVSGDSKSISDKNHWHYKLMVRD